MYTVYVLEDDSGKRYKGMTTNLERRMSEHLSGRTKTTARMRDLKIVYTERYDTVTAARKREKYFKSAAGRRFLKQQMGR